MANFDDALTKVTRVLEYPAPAEILDEITEIEEEIQKGLDELKAMLS